MDYRVTLQQGSQFTHVRVEDCADSVEAVNRVRRMARQLDMRDSKIVMYRELHEHDHCTLSA